MTIKEVERRLGITSANIRFYEKEGLLSPKRNNENNYREYDEKDIAQLQKIKFLRILGVSVPAIRELIKGDTSLEEVIAGQKETLQKEEVQLKELQHLCDEILTENMRFESLDCSLLNEQSKHVRKRLEEILSEDTSKTGLTPKEFNRYIKNCLLLAFLLDTVLATVLSMVLYQLSNKGSNYGEIDQFIGMYSQVILVIAVISALITQLSTAWTAKIKPLCANLVLAAFTLPIPLILVYFLAVFTLSGFALGMALYFCGITVFVFILGALINRYKKVIENYAYAFLLCITFTGISALTHYLLDGHWIFWSVWTFILTLDISLNWIMRNRYRGYAPDQSRVYYNKYAGIVVAIGIVNLIGGIISGSGRTRIWRRGEREFE